LSFDHVVPPAHSRSPRRAAIDLVGGRGGSQPEAIAVSSPLLPFRLGRFIPAAQADQVVSWRLGIS
jgi:hypothetical protein